MTRPSRPDGAAGDHAERGLPLRLVAAAFAAALILHGLLIVDYGDDPFATTAVSDALSYTRLAEQVREQGPASLAVFHQAPLYPWLLAAAGPASLWVQALLSALAMALLLPLGRAAFGSSGAGWCAYGLALLHGPFAFYALKLLPVTAALATQALAALAAVAWTRRPGSGRGLAAGLALGLAALVRAEVLLAAPLLLAAGWWAWRPAPLGALLRRLLPPVAGLALALTPASVLNLAAGDTVLIASSAGENLFIGNQRGADGGHAALHPRAGDIFSQRLLARQIAEQELRAPLRPSQVSRYWRSRALAEIRSDWGAWLRLEGRKLGRILQPAEPTDLYSFPLERDRYLPFARLLFVPYPTLLYLGALGAFAAWRSRALPSLPLAALCAAQLAALMIFFVSARLRMPFAFLCVPFAGLGLWQLRPGGAWPRRSRGLLAGALLAVTVLGVLAGSRVPDREVLRLASVLSAQQRVGEALATIAPLADRSTPYPLAVDQVGWLQQKAGRWQAAAEAYERALTLELPPGRAAQVWSRLGRVREQSGDLAGAAAAHDRAVADPHATAGTWYERAAFRQRRGDLAGARSDRERAGSLTGAQSIR